MVVRWMAVAMILIGLAACERPEADPLPNVRLGMAPRDVRDRLQPGGGGKWQTSLGDGDDTVLEWRADDARANVVEARFEFHLGMLVAIRAETRDTGVTGVTATAKTVTSRVPGTGSGTKLVVLARDCPTHKVEADALVTKIR